jgi:hypothetical protein
MNKFLKGMNNWNLNKFKYEQIWNLNKNSKNKFVICSDLKIWTNSKYKQNLNLKKFQNLTKFAICSNLKKFENQKKKIEIWIKIWTKFNLNKFHN